MTKLSRIGLASLLPLLVLCPIKSIAQESNEYVVNVGNEYLHFVAQPEVGYVVKTQEKTGGISTLSETLRLYGAKDIRPIRGLDRKGVSVVYSDRDASENQETIKMLRANSRVKYAAPLFSSNGETVAIIPEIVVRVTAGTNAERLQALCETMGLTIKKRMEYTEVEYLVEVLGNDADAVFDGVEQLNQVPYIEWAAPNIAFKPRLCGQVIPNDPYFSEQWHLHNIGQTGGTPEADINAPQAWEITTGDPSIVVAVIDNGVDRKHPDLKNNLVAGYDFYDNDYSPDPEVSDDPNDAHGTTCAGLIASKGNNYEGVTGVTWKCKIMPIRIAKGEKDFITSADIATAIRWAAANGADVLSISWGGIYERIIRQAISGVTRPEGMARDGKGCVVLAASGNDGIESVKYPARWPETIGVGATDQEDQRWFYSNYGASLNLVAPGDGLWTAYTDGGYTIVSGTSAACPVAAGVAALILSVNPNLTNLEVQRILQLSAHDLGASGWDMYYGFGRVDAYAAVKMALNPPPTLTIIPVCTNPADQKFPSISGDKIVWQDRRNGSADIYMWDPVNGEQPVCTNSSWQEYPSISGDRIVWRDKRNGNWDIYMWDPVNGERPVCTDPAKQVYPSISGDRIVWQDVRDGNWDIYMWDPVNGERPVCTHTAHQLVPSISGDRIVWVDERDENRDIYMWDPVNGERPVCANYAWQAFPSISGDRIVWMDERNGFLSNDIYMWDPVNGERPVCTHTAWQAFPSISGDRIVWEDERNGNYDIYMAVIPGPDLNNDGVVDFKDYGILANDWMKVSQRLAGDINKDNKVDYKDLEEIAENWIKTNNIQ